MTSLSRASGIAVDNSDTVYVAGWESHNAFKIELGDTPAGVPALPEWGLIAMSLLALTAGTLLFGRRRAQPEAA